MRLASTNEYEVPHLFYVQILSNQQLIISLPLVSKYL